MQYPYSMTIYYCYYMIISYWYYMVYEISTVRGTPREGGSGEM
jgi:hypothetical protein